MAYKKEENLILMGASPQTTGIYRFMGFRMGLDRR